MSKMKSVTIVIPAYNESDCVDELAARLKRIFELEFNYEWSVILVENGSTDLTWSKLKIIAKNDDRFKVLKLSRNFRMDGGLTAGLDYVDSEACVLMSADLQDPPEMISQFLRKWEEGFENIYGVIKKRKGTNVLRKINSVLFYKIAGKMTNRLIPENASDFRLVDRKVIDALNSIPEKARYFRGLSSWVGFKSVAVDYEREPRLSGKSTANLFAITRTGFTAITSFSVRPLRIITYFGFGLLSTSIVFTSILFINWLFDNTIPGLTSIIVLILMTSSVNLLSLGIIGEYISRIQTEVKNRPVYLIDSKINF